MAASCHGSVISLPLNLTSPEAGGISPAIILRRVDLPQPDGPVRVINSTLVGGKGDVNENRHDGFLLLEA